MGASGGCSGDVHLTVTRIAISATSKDSGDWVREHVHKWDFHPSSCHLILLYIYNLDSCYWCSHTIWLTPLAIKAAFEFSSWPNFHLFLECFCRRGNSCFLLCFFSFELVGSTETLWQSVVPCISNSSNERNKFLDHFIIFSVHDGS